MSRCPTCLTLATEPCHCEPPSRRMTFDEARSAYEEFVVATAADMIRVKQSLDADEIKRCQPRTFKVTDFGGPNEKLEELQRDIDVTLDKIQKTHQAFMKPIAEFRQEYNCEFLREEPAEAYEAPKLMKPPGLDSGIAIGMDLARREDDQVDAFVSALSAWIPERPGTMFGLDRRPPPRVRRPALPDAWRQEKARPEVMYRVYDRLTADEVLIVAMNTDGTGRMLRIAGQVWHIMKSRTNAPEGEVAITDDDMETALCVSACIVHPFQAPGDDFEPKRATQLEMELFFTDPEVVAHVRRQADIPDEAGKAYPLLVDQSERYERALTIAYNRACMGQKPEAAWLDRAMHRMRAIENRRAR